MGYSSPTINFGNNNGFCVLDFIMTNQTIGCTIKHNTSCILFFSNGKIAATTNLHIGNSLDHSKFFSI